MPKVNNETFDFIHGTQQIFRLLVDSMARPGKIVSIQESTRYIDENTGLSKELIALAYTLLDREVSFHLVGDEKGKTAQYLEWSTFSTTEAVQTADYIFIPYSLSEGDLLDLMNEVKCGTLTDPHNSATLIFHVKEVSSFGPHGKKLVMSGPGIKENSSCYIEGLPSNFIKVRKKINKEFPIGIDLIIVSSNGDMIAIPRTTKLESEDHVWGM
ncbi:phosphonate C-P lyase system protein PhnH [Bacillus sp. AK128]